MAYAAIIAAVIAAASAENSSEQARKTAHEGMDQQKALAAANPAQQGSQAPNVQSLKSNNAMAAAGSDQTGTLLTGNSGISNSSLNIGKNTLLGS